MQTSHWIAAAQMEIFQVSQEELINSGTPTRGESLILENTVWGKECSDPEQLLI